jgi:23S rRNA-/tRNA-specific pseudouridylate synthase
MACQTSIVRHRHTYRLVALSLSLSQSAKPECGRRGRRRSAVHRLDRLTSGVLLLARSSSVASKMMKQIQSFQVRKTYVARVRGRFPEYGSNSPRSSPTQWPTTQMTHTTHDTRHTTHDTRHTTHDTQGQADL